MGVLVCSSDFLSEAASILLQEMTFNSEAWVPFNNMV